MRLARFHSVANVELFINTEQVISIHHSVEPNTKTTIIAGGNHISVKESIEEVLSKLGDPRAC